MFGTSDGRPIKAWGLIWLLAPQPGGLLEGGGLLEAGGLLLEGGGLLKAGGLFSCWLLSLGGYWKGRLIRG